MSDEAQIEAAILGQLSAGPEAENRVMGLVARDLGVPTENVQRVAGRLSREGRLLVRHHGRGNAPSAVPVWHLPSQRARAADEQAVEAEVVAAIDRIAHDAGLSRPVVAELVARIATKLIARGA